MSSYDVFWVARSLRVPGLGLLVLPLDPAPAWLAALPLQGSTRLQLHRPDRPAVALLATAEEVAFGDDLHPTRALLLDADPEGPVAAGAWLEVLELAPADALL